MEIAHGEVISVPPDTDVSQVIEIMLSEGIGAVPVVESVSEKLLGVVSYEDILRVAVGFM
jgi:CBS domain-containing protein